MPPVNWIYRESWYTLLVFYFFLVKTCKESKQMSSHICKIIGIQLFSSQFYEINWLSVNVNYSKTKTMPRCYSNKKVILKCNQQVACLWNASPTIFELRAGNLWVVCYNLASLWVASCDLIIRPWERSHICIGFKSA